MAAGRLNLPATLAALLGGACAVWLYGFRVLHPSSVEWLLHGDAAQHYLGSVFFLAEPWHWPPGAIAGFGESPTSVVFTDAIPLLALLSKLLGVPPGPQYFGLWMTLCHVLAGWYGVRLLQRLGVAGTAANVVGAAFFVLSPAMLMRAYGHEALMAHFLLLAALAEALSEWRWRRWLLITAVAVLVHPYLALMTGVLAVGAAAAAGARGEAGLVALAGQGVAGLVVLAGLAWLAGYFVAGQAQISAEGHGFFSANLLTWFDPMDWAAFARTHGVEAHYVREWSRWLWPQGQAALGQYEGFAYLGAGLLSLIVIALAARAWLPRPVGNPAIARVRWFALTAGALLLAVVAVSARPSLGNWMIADLQLPEGLQRALGVFRASGRFIWPLTLLIMAWAVSVTGRLRYGPWLLVLALALQVADIHGKLKEFRWRFREGPPGVESPPTSPRWAQVLAKCPRLELISSEGVGPRWAGPVLAAGMAGASVVPAPTARLPAEAVFSRDAIAAALLDSNGWLPGTVYRLAEPLPGGVAVEEVLQRLPEHMRHLRLDGHDLVVPADCVD